MFIIHSEDTWYITNVIDAEEGDLKSGQKDEVILPEIGWEFKDHSYFDNDFDNCKTIRSYRKTKRKKTYKIRFFLVDLPVSSPSPTGGDRYITNASHPQNVQKYV